MVSSRKTKESFYKEPNYIQGIKDVKPGSVLLFRVSSSIVSLSISKAEMLVSQPHGHYDTTHAAIFIGLQDGKPMIAHIREKGFILEPLSSYCEEDRSFLAFTPDSKDIANALKKIAGDSKKNNLINQFAAGSAVFALFKTAKLDQDSSDQIDKASFCSKFVIQCLKAASLESDIIDSINYEIKLNSDSTPKALESYLYNNKYFSLATYTGVENPYATLKLEIDATIKNVSNLDKRHLCYAYFLKVITILDENRDKNDLEKTHYLLSAMIPNLKIKTGFFAARSATKVLDFSRKMRIFERDLSTKFKEEVDALIAKPIVSQKLS